tara:strand:- start:36 stop:446 length:411 start_codon:yes stop_codon:yes gene_type:complete
MYDYVYDANIQIIQAVCVEQSLKQVQHILTLWARWMRENPFYSELGYSQSCCNGVRFGSTDWDSMLEEIDDRLVRATDAIIDDLSLIHEKAILVAYLNVSTDRGVGAQEIEAAELKVIEGLKRKDLWIEPEVLQSA